MNQRELQTILNQVKFKDELFAIQPKGDGFLIQLQYYEEDVDDPAAGKTLQKARKWYVSSHATESEIVQTCMLAVLTSVEHRAREHFKYKGRRLYGPHISVSAHLGIADQTAHRPDVRPEPVLACGCPRSVLSVAEGWQTEYGHPSLAQQQAHDKHRSEEQQKKSLPLVEAGS